MTLFSLVGQQSTAGVGVKRTFLREFLRRPLEVGSIVPSSQALTDSILAGTDPASVRTYVEYGPGTGRFTEQAMRCFKHLETAVLFEINPIFQGMLKLQFPDALIRSEPGHLSDSLRGKADVVISGLPFTNIPWEISKQTIDGARALLREGGSFRTFLYVHTFFLPKNVQLRNYLEESFGTVSCRFVAANLPPAVVIEARKLR